jgi:two-component sensor histidine kinase
LEEKEVLLKEIHHRVKNNLQVISSLLYLQSRQVQDSETLEMFLDSQHRVRSMALVHERLYENGDLARVDSADYIHDLARYLRRAYGTDSGAVTLDVQVDEVPLDIDTAIPCGLIINELVSNAMKHAFPDDREGEIIIGLSRDPAGQYVLTVRDNGVGMPEGVAPRSTGSLGLRLVSRLVDQLEASIELDRNGGTGFTIKFSGPSQAEVSKDG